MLFLLTYAGGSTGIFMDWRRFLNKSIKFIPIELSGHGKKINEPLYGTMDQAISDINKILTKELYECKYAVIGHSMGALLLYEFLKKLSCTGGKKPCHVFFSGRYPPHVSKEKKDLHNLPEIDFINEIHRLGGTTNEIRENPDLRKIVIPILKADYKLIETHDFGLEIPDFNTDISVLGGRDDQEVSINDLRAWQNYTTGAYKMHIFNGGHFFIHEKKTRC